MATAEITSGAETKSQPQTLSVQRFPVNEDESQSYLKAEKGLWAWMTTVDHKKIGLMYLAAITFFFTMGGIMALLIRTELIAPGPTIMNAEAYNRLFTLHGTIMIFLFLVPSIPTVLGNFFLPMQIGAKDVAFPRLNLASFYIYLLGAGITLYAIISGGVDTGWTFYTPYSTSTNTAVLSMTLGIFIIGFSSILTGVNFITTLHKLRAPGMTWGKLPLFCWGLYATSIIQVLATPVLAITLMLLIMERLMGVGIFTPALGGDPILYQHFFWFYSHPAVYIMIVPGFGVMSELITAFSRKSIFGYWPIAISSLAIAFIAFLVWGHHMFVSGQASIASMVFSFLTFLVGIPTGIKIFNWVATMYKGSITLKTPMLYALTFLVLFTLGGLTGVMVATLSMDVHLHDTYYIVAHFHYVMVGGMVMAFLGGLHYWWPKMFGKMYSEKWGRIAWGLIFVGFNGTFLPQFVLGSRGMPRRYFDYMEKFHTLHEISSIGAYVLGLGFLIMAVYLTHSLFRGKKAPANPWGARTLEWAASASPPIQHNFNYTPVIVNRPYDFHKPLDEFQLGISENGRGTVGTKLGGKPVDPQPAS